MISTSKSSAMNPQERALLLAETNDREPQLSLATDTRVDTGRWLGRSRLWLNIVDDQFVLIAASKRVYCQSIAIAACQESWYCHTTGQLVLEPAEGLRFNQLKMPPTDALGVLDRIQGNSQPAGEDTPSQTKDRHASIHS